MFFVRWIPTFLAFPLAGLLAMLIVGPNRTPLTALAVGAIVGAIVGGAQWLALGRLVGPRWAIGTFGATAAGSAISMLAVGPPVTSVSALVTGLITGVAVGAVQGVLLRSLLRKGLGTVAVWTATVGISWAVAWLVTSAVIVDLDRGHAVFGSSGALLATIVTGVVLRIVFVPLVRREPRDAGATATVDGAVTVVAAATDTPRKAG